MADPFADASFAPIPGQAPIQNDPFAAAGFSPVQSAGAAAPTMPAPVGWSEFGAPIFDDTAEGKAAGRQERGGELRMAEKVGEGATLGMLPHAIAAVRTLGGTPYQEGLQGARDFTAQTSKDYPVPAALAEGAGSIGTGLGLFRTAAPAIDAAASYAPRVGGALGRALASAGIGATSSLGHDVGSGDYGGVGTDMATGVGLGAALSGAGDVAGRAAQAVPNMARGVYQGVRNITTDSGRTGVVGQILREAGGEFPNQAAGSPIPGLNLRVPQATGNPGLAGLERSMASEPGIQGGDLGGLVQGGRTSDQTSALAASLVGADGRIEPAVLANQASTRGVQAIHGVNDALKGIEGQLWNHPALSGVALNGPGIAGGVSQDVAGFPASWRDAVTGPQAKLGAYLRELHDLGPDASIPDVNSVRSRLLGAARDAASGPQPDSVTAAAANRMAGSILDHIGNDPAITGAPASTKFFMTEPMPLTHVEVPDPVTIRAMPSAANSNVVGGDTNIPVPQAGGAPRPNDFAITKPVAVSSQVPVPIRIRASASAETPGNPAALQAYQDARDFTRQFNQAKGYNEFNNILHPNAQGNMQGNPEKQFGQFFDLGGGTNSGLQRLQGLSDFARQSGLAPHAAELEDASREYINASILRQSRAGNGLDATGQPSMNLATLASTTNRLAPTLSSTPMTAPMAGDVQAAGNAAELLNRPSTMRGDTNSTTYEKLRNNDLVSAIVGQSGSSALGAAAGGYAGYKAGDATGQPPYATIPLGMMVGALAGNRAGPAIGNVISHTPIIKGAVTGPSEAIRRQVWDALSNMPAYERALATPMLSGPSLGAPGAASRAVPALARALIPTAANGGAR